MRFEHAIAFWQPSSAALETERERERATRKSLWVCNKNILMFFAFLLTEIGGRRRTLSAFERERQSQNASVAGAELTVRP
jgi:hypothetical protein